MAVRLKKRLSTWRALASFIILKVIDMVIGLRVTDEQEREGLDQALHGEAVH